jgi:hypothetical protein
MVFGGKQYDLTTPERLKIELNLTAYPRRGSTCARLWPKSRNVSSVSVIASLIESRPLAMVDT